MVRLIGSFKALRQIHVLVIGDFVLDTYVKGVVGRISPEAPVPVLHVKEQFQSPGMAGNVALNLVSLGAKVSVCGRFGDDVFGKNLIAHLENETIDTSAMVLQKEYATPAKSRMIASAQQLLRVDYESDLPLSKSLEAKLLRILSSKIKEVDVVAISDYKKGFLTDKLLKFVIGLAKEKNIPVVVDPKGDSFIKYEGATLIKPNLAEAFIASKQNKGTSLDAVGKILLKETKAEYLLITRSEEGITLFDKKAAREDFPVTSREVTDVTGAGDTVLAVITMAMGNNLPMQVSVQLANVAAGIAIQKLGCARVTLAQIAEQLLQIDASNKIFSEDHYFALKEVLKGKSLTILTLDEKQEMTTELFYSIRSLHKEADPNHRLIVSLKESKHADIFGSLLCSLREVDFVLYCSSSFALLFKEDFPKTFYHMKDNLLKKIKNPTTLLQELSNLQKA